jgi:hypothetical protein
MPDYYELPLSTQEFDHRNHLEKEGGADAHGKPAAGMASPEPLKGGF